MMLSKKQKQELRKYAQSYRAVVQIGKENISDNMIKSLHDALEAHELVKISMLKTCSLSIQEAALDLSAATNSEIVQIIGRVIVLYRRSKKNLMEL